MLTEQEYQDAMDAHIEGATQLAVLGKQEEAMRMVTGILHLAWELTRPDVEMNMVDISHRIPDEYRSRVAGLAIFVIVQGENKALMAWGKGVNADGNDVTHQLDDERFHNIFMDIIDTEISVRFAHLDLKTLVSEFDDVTGRRRKETEVTTTHIAVTEEHIDKQVEAFSEEFDRLFSIWEGGDDNG